MWSGMAYVCLVLLFDRTVLILLPMMNDDDFLFFIAPLIPGSLCLAFIGYVYVCNESIFFPWSTLHEREPSQHHALVLVLHGRVI